MDMVRRVGVLTSGGDAPGMNAAVRTIVRAALHYNLEPWAIYRGYHGLIEANWSPWAAGPYPVLFSVVVPF